MLTTPGGREVVSTVGPTIIVCVMLTGALFAFPAWVADIEHVPGATRVAVLPDTVQTVAEFDVNAIPSPEDTEADKATVPVLRGALAGRLNEIVWLCNELLIVKERVGAILAASLASAPSLLNHAV